MVHMASMGRHYSSSSTVDQSSKTDTTVHGGIHAHTQATDAKGIAGSLDKYLFQGRDARQANRGLA